VKRITPAARLRPVRRRNSFAGPNHRLAQARHRMDDRSQPWARQA